MYEILYDGNILFKSLLSIAFISLNIFFSLIIDKKYNLNDKTIFSNFSPLLIFFSSFALLVFIISCSVLIDYKLINIFISLIIIIQITYVIFNFHLVKKILEIKRLIKNYIFIFYFTLLLLISLLPLSDADSIAIYQYIPSTIYLNGFINFDFVKDIEFLLLSNAEILLVISAYLKSDNFGAILNTITLFFFVAVTFNKNKNFLYVILSSPLILYFISTQKLQLFFGILFLTLFVIAHSKKINNKLELFIFALLLTFFSSGKFYYLIFSFILFVYFFLKNKSYWKEIILFFSLSFFIVYFPIFLIKQVNFGNIFAPFFDSMFGNNVESFMAFQKSIRSTEGWISNPSKISQYFRPFISFKLDQLSSSLGLVFLIMLMNLKLLKKTFFVPIILIISILITGQILPRYYFEAFLILAYYFTFQNQIIKYFLWSQIAVITIVSLTYVYISYYKFNVIFDNSKYMNNFSYSYYNAQQINNVNLSDNILDLSLDRQSIFLKKNVFSTRYLRILDNYNHKYQQNLIKLINDKTIKYIITHKTLDLPNCLVLEEIDETYRKTARRNFLINSKKNLYKTFKINNKC